MLIREKKTPTSYSPHRHPKDLLAVVMLFSSEVLGQQAGISYLLIAYLQPDLLWNKLDLQNKLPWQYSLIRSEPPLQYIKHSVESEVTYSYIYLVCVLVVCCSKNTWNNSNLGYSCTCLSCWSYHVFPILLSVKN